MNSEDLDKEQVKEMSEEEIVLAFEKLAKTEQAEKMRKHMLNQIEIRNANRTHVDSKVIN